MSTVHTCAYALPLSMPLPMPLSLAMPLPLPLPMPMPCLLRPCLALGPLPMPTPHAPRPTQAALDKLRQQLTAVEAERNDKEKCNAELSARLTAMQEKVSHKELEVSRAQDAVKEQHTDMEKAREQGDRLARELRQSEVAMADLKRQLQQGNDNLQQQNARIAKLEVRNAGSAGGVGHGMGGVGAEPPQADPFFSRGM